MLPSQLLNVFRGPDALQQVGNAFAATLSTQAVRLFLG